MKKEVGLWIDHRNAVIVTIEEDSETTRKVDSNVEQPGRSSGGIRAQAPKGSAGSTAENMRDRKVDNHLGKYYEGIVSIIRDADTIWIFGPGEAKIELENQLNREELGARILGIDTVDKMTERQIAAKVRDRFLR